MKIIKEFSIGKRPNQELNEDGYAVVSDSVIVVDGATSKDSLNPNSGRIAKDCVLESFTNNYNCEDPYELINILNSSITCGKASFILYQGKYKRIVIYGDCQAMINDELYRNKSNYEEIVSYMRSAAFHKLIKNHTYNEMVVDDLAREQILPLLVKYENEHVKHVDVINVKSGDTVVLASDGYPEIYKSLAETEARLRFYNEVDPMCISINKGTKGIIPGNNSYDDRTYVKFIV